MDQQLGHIKDAGERLRTTVDQLILDLENPSAGYRYLAAGLICEFRNSLMDAEIWYRRSLDEGDEARGYALARLAIVLGKSGRFKESLSEAIAVTEDYPNLILASLGGHNTSGFAVLGDALRSNGDVLGALEAYSHAVKLCPEDRHSCAEYAMMLLQDGRYQEARALASSLGSGPSRSVLRSALLLNVDDPTLQLPAVARVALSLRTNRNV